MARHSLLLAAFGEIFNPQELSYGMVSTSLLSHCGPGIHLASVKLKGWPVVVGMQLLLKSADFDHPCRHKRHH